MTNYWVGAFALLGLLINMSFSGTVMQPDWSLAILLATLLSNRHTWYWVLPCIGFHDWMLYWSVWVTFPYMLAVALMVATADVRLAPGQQQRWFGLVLGCLPLLLSGVGLLTWILTMMLTVWLWFVFSARRDKVYAEPV